MKCIVSKRRGHRKIGCFSKNAIVNRFMEMIQDPLLKKLTENIKSSLGQNLRKILLFGSRARGDFQIDSDYDILVLVGEYHQDIRKKLNDIGGDFFYEYFKNGTGIILTFTPYRYTICYPF